MNNEYYEEVVDLKDLCIYILKKWREILIGLLVGLILGCLFSFYNMQKNDPIKRINSILNNIDSINVNNVNKYAELTEIYKENEDYLADSILMSLNQDNVYTGTKTFSINSDSSGLSSYNNFLSNEFLTDKRWGNLKYKDIDLQHLLDLLTFTKSYTVLSDGKYAETIVLKVYGDNQDLVKSIMDVAEEILVDFAQNHNYDFNILQNSIVYGSDNTLVNLQREKTNAQQSLLSSLTTLKSNFNSDEELYYSYIFDYDNFIKLKPSFSMKYPAIFAVAFAILVAGYYFMKYLFDTHVKTEDEITNKFKLSSLATIKVSKDSNNVIDKMIDKLNKVDTNDYSYLKSVIKNLNNKKILVCNGFIENDEDLKQLDKRLVVLGTLDNDEKAIDALKSVDGVILTNKYWKTNSNSLQKQIDILKKNNKDIIGVINYL